MGPRSIVVITLCAVSAGCVNAQARQANLAMFEKTIPTCSTTEECSLKWSAAFRFIQKSCSFRIQHYNDNFIATHQSGDYANTGLACEAVKEPLGDGAFRIVAKFWVNNAFSVGEAEARMTQFNEYVNAGGVPAAAK